MNAKQELIENLNKAGSKMKCAAISYRTRDHFDNADINLKVNYTEYEYFTFMARLNFEYNAGYGAQELFGTVWLEDGTWLSRGEYDGSEWWEHNKLPDIPQELLTR